jgi:hypothetical protein
MSPEDRGAASRLDGEAGCTERLEFVYNPQCGRRLAPKQPSLLQDLRGSGDEARSGSHLNTIRATPGDNNAMDQPVEPHAIAEAPEFLAGEQAVERRSEELRKELSLPNLVFTQVLAIVGLSWIGTAGKLGSSHLAFWLAAIVLFYVPSAACVIHLNNEMPLEGGLYQWAKLRFNEMTGFLVAWNLWIYAIVFVSEMGPLVTNHLSYAMGPSGAWLANSKLAIAAASLTRIS